MGRLSLFYLERVMNQRQKIPRMIHKPLSPSSVSILELQAHITGKVAIN